MREFVRQVAVFNTFVAGKPRACLAAFVALRIRKARKAGLSSCSIFDQWRKCLIEIQPAIDAPD